MPNRNRSDDMSVRRAGHKRSEGTPSVSNHSRSGANRSDNISVRRADHQRSEGNPSVSNHSRSDNMSVRRADHQRSEGTPSVSNDSRSEDIPVRRAGQRRRGGAPSASERISGFQEKREAVRVPGVGAFSVGAYFFNPATPTFPSSETTLPAVEEDGPSLFTPQAERQRYEAPPVEEGEAEYSTFGNSVMFNSSERSQMDYYPSFDNGPDNDLQSVNWPTEYTFTSTIGNQINNDAEPNNLNDENFTVAESGHVFCGNKRAFKSVCSGLLLVALTVAGIVGLAAVLTRSAENITDGSEGGLIDAPTVSPRSYICDRNDTLTTDHTTRYQAFQSAIESSLKESTPFFFDEPCSPYDLALTWIADYDNLDLSPTETTRINQRFAVGLLYYSTTLSSDPNVTRSIDPLIFQLPSTKHECTWTGITCDKNSSIIGIELSGLKLEGSIPNEMPPLLPVLKILDLSENDLGGTIPSSLFSSPKLVTLDLTSNKFSGPIDTMDWKTENLERLILHNNELSGTIPASIASLKHLLELDLSKNRFSGPIPDAIFNGRQLRKLILRDNNLTGTLPVDMASTLKHLDLTENNLKGELPMKLFNLRQLVILELSSNGFVGTLSDQIKNLQNLEALVIRNTRIRGPIPSSIATLPILGTIILEENRLTGTISPDFGNMPALVQLSLSSNSLTGSIPTQLGNLSFLTFLDLYQNRLSGTIPTEFSKLTQLKMLDLSANMLTGEVSPEVCELRQGYLIKFSADCFKGGEVVCSCCECVD